LPHLAALGTDHLYTRQHLDCPQGLYVAPKLHAHLPETLLVDTHLDQTLDDSLLLVKIHAYAPPHSRDQS
jgi:hypothetical protein